MLVLAPIALTAAAALPPQQSDPVDTAITSQQAVPDHLRGAEAARLAGAAWLAAHQDEDGKWDSDAFAKHDRGPATPPEDEALWDDRWLDEKPVPRPVGDGVATWRGEGAPVHDVGVTGLALLALMADGSTTTEGPYEAQLKRGVAWLRSMQDPETGLLGEEVGHTYVYGHAIGTLALVTALQGSDDDSARNAAQRAVDFISRARNPYGAWRYEVPPNGDNDTSVTTWMVLALGEAQRAGLKFDRNALEGAKNWLEEMTDPETGRVGYTEKGSRSSRVPGVNVQFSIERAETLTAAGLLSRLTLGQRPAESPVMIDHVRLMLRSVPASPPASIDEALWVFFGTRATSWLGGKPWKLWSEAFVPAIVASQSKAGDAAGSWDPKNAWGYSMGRIGTTALMTWTLASVDGAPDDGAVQRTR